MHTPVETLFLETLAALNDMLAAVCGPTGFAATVRKDSGYAYSWPALDAAEDRARRVLAKAEGR